MKVYSSDDFIERMTSTQQYNVLLVPTGTKDFLRVLLFFFNFKGHLIYFFNSYTSLNVYYSLGLYTVFLNSQHIITTWFVMCHHNLVTFRQKFMIYIKAVINTWRNSSVNRHQYFCWTCGSSFHLGCLAPGSMKNNATVCIRVDAFCSCIQLPYKSGVSLCPAFLFTLLESICCSSSLWNCA